MSKFIPPFLRHLFFGREDRRKWGKILKNNSSWCYLVITWNFRVVSDFFQSTASYLELVGGKDFQSFWKQSNFMWKNTGFRIKSDGGFVDLATSSRSLFVLEVWFRMLCYTRLYRKSEASAEIPTVSWGLPWARLIKIFKAGMCFGMFSGPASGT